MSRWVPREEDGALNNECVPRSELQVYTYVFTTEPLSSRQIVNSVYTNRQTCRKSPERLVIIGTGMLDTTV